MRQFLAGLFLASCLPVLLAGNYRLAELDVSPGGPAQINDTIDLGITRILLEAPDSVD